MISFPALPNDPLGLEPGVRYLFDDSIAADFLKNDLAQDWRREEFAHFAHPEDMRTWHSNRHYHAEKMGMKPSEVPPVRVLIIRCGGIGDLLFMTPALAALLERFPEVEFTLCAFERYRPIIAHPKLDRLQWLDYPPKMDDVNAFDAVVPLEGVVEKNHDRPAIALFAEALGITDLPATAQPLFRVPSEGLLAAQTEFPKAPSVKFYGIGLRAGHDARTWPFEYCEQAAKLLLDRDPQCIVFLFGERDKFPGIEGLEHPRVVWLPAADLNLKETLAVLALMDGWIGPDSGLTHAAGALGIPGVGIFGAFQWQTRLPEGSSIRGLNGYAPCAPCHHLARSSRWVKGAPCEKANCCIALAAIQPDRVVGLLLKQLRNEGTEHRERRLYAIESLFGPVARRGDVHPELERAEEFHLGNWGAGAATIEEAQFLHALVLVLKPMHCLETGTETGWTAAHIAAALERNGKGHLVTLEIDPKRAEEARQHLAAEDLDHRVRVVEVPALVYLGAIRNSADNPLFNGAPIQGEWPMADGKKLVFHPPDKIDFALLDTHIPLRLDELRALTPHLAPGAVVCVHDTHPEHPMRAGTNLLADLRAVPGFTVLHLPSPRGLTVMQWKTAAGGNDE